MNMNPKIVTGIAIALALVIICGWYWLFMTPRALAPAGDAAMAPAPEQSVNGAAMSEDAFAATLAGDWRSKDDAKFTRQFTADGTVTDRYEGMDDATTMGEWEIVSDPSREPILLPVVKDAKIMRIQFPEEALYFAVTGATATDLSLVYLNGAGNGNLEFTRVR